MKKISLTLLLVITSFQLFSQNESKLSLITDYSALNPELRDILNFEKIEYLKLKFQGEDLIGKSYKIETKEIWNGKVKKDTILVDSKRFPVERLQSIKDSVFNLKIISKHTEDNKLKMEFKFDQLSIGRLFDATDSNSYSLRNVAHESNLDIKVGEKFYLLAYILPYDLGNGYRSYCEVATNGKDIENWGEKYKIEHYITFEIIFE